MKKRRTADSEDGEGDEDDESEGQESEESEEIEDKDTKLADKITKPREMNVVMNSFLPHEIHHFAESLSEHWNYQMFRYYLNESQYVIANSD